MSWQTSVYFVHVAEGGDNLSVPTDMGGHTWGGISERAFPKDKFAWFWDAPTLAKRDRILFEHFWEPHRIALLPEHYQVVALDCVVNHSPTDAIKLFQRGLGEITVDGIAGPKTLARAKEDYNRVDEILAARSNTYLDIVQRLPEQEANWVGWLRRSMRLAVYAAGVRYGIPFDANGELSRYE